MERVLAIRTRALGETHEDTSTARKNLKFVKEQVREQETAV